MMDELANQWAANSFLSNEEDEEYGVGKYYL